MLVITKHKYTTALGKAAYLRQIGDVARLFEASKGKPFYDTEVKIFETIANQLGGVKGKVFTKELGKKYSGTITVASELKACESCEGVMQQFKKMFPDIKINFASSAKETFVTPKK